MDIMTGHLFSIKLSFFFNKSLIVIETWFKFPIISENLSLILTPLKFYIMSPLELNMISYTIRSSFLPLVEHHNNFYSVWESN